jgi:hypothetical protein
MAKDEELMYSELKKGLEEIRSIVVAGSRGLGRRRRAAALHERFRLELWVRESPTGTNRKLVLWGYSTGPIKERNTLWESQILLGSDTASVRAFTDGAPRHLSLKDLDSPDAKSAEPHWKSFLAVPIWVQVNSTWTPTGVVTLSTASDKREASLPLSNQLMNYVVEKMIELGRELLKP